MWANCFATGINLLFLLQLTNGQQTDQASDDLHEDYGSYQMAWAVCLLLKVAIVVYLLGSLLVSGNLVPLFGFYETLQLLIHLPLISVELPGMVAAFMLPFTDLVKFNFIPLNQAIRRQWRAGDGEGFNTVFE